MKKILLLLSASILIYACGSKSTSADENASKALQDSVQIFLNEYNQKYQELSVITNETDWKSNTHIVEGDTTNATALNNAQEEYAKFTGSKYTIERAKTF